jgi:sigma-B regulation protein RsbU (phosphoserine phosphatase)
MNRKPKILIADDNKDMVFLLKKGVGQEDYDFVEASDGEETLKKIAEEKPDLILLDVKMPKKSGLDVIRELRNNFEFRDVPVIVLTVVDNPEEKVKALELGASDFLVKPPSSAELKARVNTHLQLHRISTIFKRYSEHLETLVSRKSRELKDFADRLEEMVDERVGFVKRQNEEIMMGLKAAQKIQRSFLPVSFPKVSGLAYRTVYRARDLVGGDVYNVFRIDEDTVGILIADVSGHGIPSAMITVFMKQEVLYHSKALHPGGGYSVTSPAELLKKVNRSFVENNIGEGGYFVTAVYCTYSLSRRELKMALAGHHALPILQKANGDTEILWLEGFPIGWFEDVDDYAERVLRLDKGDTLLFYTDGLFELCGEGGAGLTLKDLVPSITAMFKDGEMDREVRSILARRSGANDKLQDDLTLLLMEVN